MATKKGKFLSGLLGPVVLRKLNGQQIISGRPDRSRVKQTARSKISNNTFGSASKLAKQLRMLFLPWIEGLYDYDMGNRMHSALMKCLVPSRDLESGSYNFDESSFDHLRGLEFNKWSPANSSMRVEPSASIRDGIINVHIPGTSEFEQIIGGTQWSPLKYPRGTTHCEVTIAVAHINLADGTRVSTPYRQTWEVKRREMMREGIEQDEINFTMPALEGCLCIVGIFLKFYHLDRTYKHVYNHKKFSPGFICSVELIPGEYKLTDDFFWVKMGGLTFEQF